MGGRREMRLATIGTLVTCTVGVAVRDGLWHRLRGAKGHDLQARFSIIFLFASTVPIQSDTVVAGFALTLAVGTGGLFLSTEVLSASAGTRKRGNEDRTILLCETCKAYEYLRRLAAVLSALERCTHQQPFLERFLTSFPSWSGFFGRGMASAGVSPTTFRQRH